MADHRLPALRRGDPRPVDPRRVVAHMLVVAAGEFGDPVAGVVLVKADDASLQAFNVPHHPRMALLRATVWMRRLADQLVVLRVRANPKPHDAVRGFDADRPIMSANSR